MKQKYKNLVKDTLIFALGSLGSKVILFFLVPLYTNYLTTEEYGISDLVSTFSSLLIPITSLVIGSALIRFGMMRSEKKEDAAVASFVVIAFSAIATIALTPIIGLYKPISEWKIYLCAQVILSNLSEVERTYLKVKDRNKLFSIISVLQTAVLAGVNIILLTVFHLGIEGYLFAIIAAQGFSVIAAFFAGNLFNDLRNGSFNIVLLKRMLRYSAPLIFSNTSWWIVHSSDKIMIEAMITASALGLYTAATKIPSLINVIIGIFNQAWGISSIKEIESTSETGFYTCVFRLFSTFLFGACAIFISFVKPFMSIYVGNEFRSAWVYTPFLLSAAVLFSISAFIGTLYAALQKTKNDMWTTIICAVVNIIVNYIGISFLGTWGAVIGTVSAYFVCSTLRIFDIRRLMRFEVGYVYWINTLLMLLHALAVSFQWYSGIVSVVAIMSFICLNREELLLITRKMVTLL